MAPRITHAKVSSRPAGNDPGRVYGPDWNDDHVIAGLTIGTDVQAHNASLDSLSALDAMPGLVAETAANSFAKRTLIGTANRIAVSNGDGAAGNPTIDIAAGYSGQTTITSLGTVTTGAWNGQVVNESFGGTNQSAYTLGDLLYASAANTLAKLGGNSTSTRKFLRQTGTGTASAAPGWDTLTAADVPASALTAINDTNITLILGGVPTSALLAATSITIGWSGTLAAGRLNANVVQGVTNDTNVTGAIAAQNLTLGWSGTLSGARGGTGVNNGAGTITVGGNFSTAGAAALPAIAQGDLWYGSAAGVKSALTKNSSATRYLANTGTSNNPAWDQVNLGNGVTGTLAIASGGTAQTSAAAARGSSGLNVESFTGHGDSNYTILATDKVVGTNASFTASHTWTLPAASAVNPGQPVVVADFQGTVTSTNTLVIARAGSDTINGSTSVTINGANGAYILWSDGSSKWTAQAIGAAASSGVSTFNGRSGAVNPAQGDYTANLIAGTGTNDNATAGNIGEYKEASLASGSAVTLTSSSVINVTSVSLTAGDWDITGHASISIPNDASHQLTNLTIGISAANNTQPLNGSSGKLITSFSGVNMNQLPNLELGTDPLRVSLAGTTTYYLNVTAVVSSGGTNPTGYGEIRARRVR